LGKKPTDPPTRSCRKKKRKGVLEKAEEKKKKLELPLLKAAGVKE